MDWMVCSVCYVGCMVANINALFAEWRIPKRDYSHTFLLGILSGMEPTRYLLSDIDAVTATFHVLVKIYFLNFRLVLRIVLRALDVVRYYQQNAFKIPKMLEYKHRSLMISVNNAEYIYLLPIFRTIYCKINSFQSYLFCYKCWLSYFLEIE